MLTEQPSAPMQSAAMTPTTSPASSVMTKLDEILVGVGVRDRVRARARDRVQVGARVGVRVRVRVRARVRVMG